MGGKKKKDGIKIRRLDSSKQILTYNLTYEYNYINNTVYVYNIGTLLVIIRA